VKIGKNSVVSLTYRLTDAQGEFIEETDEPVVYLHGGYEGIFSRIEEALEGKEVGYKSTLSLEPADAFGDYDAE
jgi:FKBP-type peptidyl-prolyl cis-trans isomerase SlyD